MIWCSICSGLLTGDEVSQWVVIVGGGTPSEPFPCISVPRRNTMAKGIIFYECIRWKGRR
jgi:hypothetical protein